jgi:hypothetical protein
MKEQAKNDSQVQQNSTYPDAGYPVRQLPG